MVLVQVYWTGTIFFCIIERVVMWSFNIGGEGVLFLIALKEKLDWEYFVDLQGTTQSPIARLLLLLLSEQSLMNFFNVSLLALWFQWKSNCNCLLHLIFFCHPIKCCRHLSWFVFFCTLLWSDLASFWPFSYPAVRWKVKFWVTTF